jgi:hypothetical protein
VNVRNRAGTILNDDINHVFYLCLIFMASVRARSCHTAYIEYQGNEKVQYSVWSLFIRFKSSGHLEIEFN